MEFVTRLLEQAVCFGNIHMFKLKKHYLLHLHLIYRGLDLILTIKSIISKNAPKQTDKKR